MTQETIYSVTQIAQALRRDVERKYGTVTVRGEVSNGMRAASGHYYCRLKDDQSVLEAVCWRSVFARLLSPPQDGMEVECRGRLSIYGGRSVYQLVIEQMRLAGTGDFHRKLAQLRERLAKEGLFAAARKKPLPFMPRRIGVVTSPQGAVLRDIVVRVRARCPTHIVVYPVKVQGDEAKSEIAHAIDFFNNRDEAQRPDVLIVGRGGGSIEDLWAFNEEEVVRAIARSVIPVISAVGHETDVTLSDDVADQRAATPTAAAELATPLLAQLQSAHSESIARMRHAMMAVIARRKELWQLTARALVHPQHRIEHQRRALDEKMQRWQWVINTMLRRHRDAIAAARRVVEAHSYRHILRQGYALVHRRDGTQSLVARKSQVGDNHQLTIEWFDGSLDVTGET